MNTWYHIAMALNLENDVYYEIQEHPMDKYGGKGTFEVHSCYSRYDNNTYIGDIDRTLFLLRVKHLSKIQRAEKEHLVCSIGWCEREHKWYGWSHRAIFGFGIGSEVKSGHCAYKAKDKDDFLLECVNFWEDEDHLFVIGDEVEQEGLKGVRVSWVYSDKILNKSLRGKIGSHFSAYPESYGKGEWTAKYLNDAKEMAKDFAVSIS